MTVLLINCQAVMKMNIGQKAWIAGTVAHHPQLNCVEQVLPKNQRKKEFAKKYPGIITTDFPACGPRFPGV